MMFEFPLKINALKVSQKIGSFYVVVLPASILQEITFSYPAQFSENILTGTQRKLKAERVEQISKYAGTIKATFPNAIILGANYNTNGDFIEDESLRWSVDEGRENCRLIIPTSRQMASIIDGQHRLEGIKKYLNTDPNPEDVDLVCTVFMDMASPFQAEIFATINYTQQQVDKSLAYQLFGYRLDETKSDEWAPETLAVYLSRVLNNDEDSPFHNRIKSGLYEERDPALLKYSDISDLNALIRVLTSSEPRVYKYIYDKLDLTCKMILLDQDVTNEYKVNLIVDSLNNIIKSKTIWDPIEFNSIYLADETKTLLEMKSAKYKTRLNRRLIEDVFPDLIIKSNLPNIGDWSLSTAAIVEGITKLISSKPIEDRYKIHKKGWFEKGRRMLQADSDSSPLRSMYIENNDKGIYQIIVNYFKAVDELLWRGDNNEFIVKTIGILALFDVLKHILIHDTKRDIRKYYFAQLLEKSKEIDFGDNYFHASGSGRTRVKNTLLFSLDLDSDSHRKTIATIKDKFYEEYSRLAHKSTKAVV